MREVRKIADEIMTNGSKLFDFSELKFSFQRLSMIRSRSIATAMGPMRARVKGSVAKASAVSP